MWFGVTIQAETKKTCLKKIIGLCAQNILQCDINSRLNSQHNWRDLYNHLMSARIFTLITNKIFIQNLHEERGYEPCSQFQERRSRQKAGGDANAIHRICCPSNLFSSILLVIITLTLQNFQRHHDIIKGDRDNKEGVSH